MPASIEGVRQTATGTLCPSMETAFGRIYENSGGDSVCVYAQVLTYEECQICAEAENAWLVLWEDAEKKKTYYRPSKSLGTLQRNMDLFLWIACLTEL